MSPVAKGMVAGVAVVAAVVLFFVIRDGDDAQPSSSAAQTTSIGSDQNSGPKPGQAADKPEEPKPEKPEEPEVATIVVKGGQPLGGVQELSFSEGEAIRFVVESDVADHVHLHGYDVMQDVAAGGRTEFDVPATISGVFEAELEDSVVPVAEITVEPK